MVIELLTITLPPGSRDAYVERDAAVWTPFLQQQPGFLGKETWLPTSSAHTVVFVIRWRSRAEWKQVTPEICAEVDARMGEPAPVSVECSEFTFARLQNEG